MSDSVRLVLSEILKQRHSVDEPQLTPDKYFEIFSAEQILKSHAFDLDMPEIKSGIIGGGDDGGVDSIYLFVNKRLIREDTNLADFKDQQLNIELLIIQSKNTASFGESALDKLKDFTENCLAYGVDLNKVSKQLYNQNLRDVVKRFHSLYRPALPLRPMLNMSYYYATRGEQIHPKVTTRKELLLARIQDFYSTATSSCILAGAKQLWKWFNQPISSTIPLESCKSMAWPKFGKSFVGLVPLGSFYKFITLDGNLRGHIFEANVRDYHKDATVNKKIATELDAPGKEDFWWLNNGITIISSEAVGGWRHHKHNGPPDRKRTTNVLRDFLSLPANAIFRRHSDNPCTRDKDYRRKEHRQYHQSHQQPNENTRSVAPRHRGDSQKNRSALVGCRPVL